MKPAPGPRQEALGEGERSSLLARLFRSEAPGLARYLRRRLGAADDAEDLVQDAFLRMLRLGDGAPIGRPQAYLQRVVRNLMIDHLRSEQQRSAAAVALRPDEEALPPEQELGLDAEALLDAYREAIASLPPRRREVFMLHRIDGLTYGQMAGRLGISVSGVEKHMMKSLIHIDRQLHGR